MNQDPQPLDRRLSDGTLRAGKRLPLDRRVSDLTLRAGKRGGWQQLKPQWPPAIVGGTGRCPLTRRAVARWPVAAWSHRLAACRASLVA